MDFNEDIYSVNKLSHRVWIVSNYRTGNIVYYNSGFKCTCPRFIRTGRCEDIRQVLRNNEEPQREELKNEG